MSEAFQLLNSGFSLSFCSSGVRSENSILVVIIMEASTVDSCHDQR